MTEQSREIGASHSRGPCPDDGQSFAAAFLPLWLHHTGQVSMVPSESLQRSDGQPLIIFVAVTVFLARMAADTAGDPRHRISGPEILQCFFDTILLDQGARLLDRVSGRTIGLTRRGSGLVVEPFRENNLFHHLFTELGGHGYLLSNWMPSKHSAGVDQDLKSLSKGYGKPVKEGR